MHCKDLGGACYMTFTADTFDEVARLSKQHGADMVKQQDPSHLKAMAIMRGKMNNPEAMEAWFESKRQMFEDLPEDEAEGLC